MRCWKSWIKAAGIRAVKTVAQSAVAMIGTSAVLGQVDWLMVGSAAAHRDQPLPCRHPHSTRLYVWRKSSDCGCPLAERC